MNVDLPAAPGRKAALSVSFGKVEIKRSRNHTAALDDHSRYNLLLSAYADEQGRTVRRELELAFRRYGLPLAMLMDGGSPWSDPGGEPTGFSVWLMRLGIWVLHGRPRHPQTQGKQKRFRRTLKAEVINGRSFGDLADCQRAFDQWRLRYNHERPHEALGMAKPADRYRPSSRDFCEVVPRFEYAPGDHVRKIQQKGATSLFGRAFKICNAFAGKAVAFRPTEKDGVFDVYFRHQKIHTIDLNAISR